MQDMLTLASVFGALGLLSLAAALVVALRRAVFLARAARTTGEVTAIEDSGEFPVVTFEAAGEALRNGRVVRFRAASNVGRWAVGKRVDVLYDPRGPERASVATFGQVWGLCVALALMGVMFLAMSEGVARLARDARPVSATRRG